MHVAMYYSNDDVRIEEMPIPEINDDEMLVKVKACGICGSDVMEWYRIKKAPRVLGHEMTGDVVKTGKNVKKYSVGDRVFVSHHVPCNTCRYCLLGHHTLCKTLHSTNFYPGGFAEYLRVPSINVDRGVFLLPSEMTYDEGVFIEPLACVIRGIRTVGFTPGCSVLIIGSGVSGLLYIKLVKALGCGSVFSTDINNYRLSMAKKMGADAAIHASENVPDIIKKHNDGNLADLVVVCTGAVSAAKQAFESVQPGGAVLLFAPTQPGISIPLPLFDLWNKQVKIVSTYAGAPVDIELAIRLIKSKQVMVKDLITHRFPLKDAAEGFKLVADAGKSLKVILYP
ncbi:alcohol dehydrogenase [Euryarchaeota archaeon ex4484_162]|nr:MAG: alcohol dehydrogenase [Euryarchaeota archaeon ex4484_162]RLF28983.1 MAG: alcohol dehydrogenase [Thermoplasmata archaeon]